MKKNENEKNKVEEEDEEGVGDSQKNINNLKEYELLLFGSMSDDNQYIDEDEIGESEININRALKIYTIKDYLMMIFLLLSSSLDFSALYMPCIFLGISYIFLLLKQNNSMKDTKMKIEIICLIYSVLLLIAKSVLIGIINNGYIDYESHFVLFSNLGIRYINVQDSDFKIMLNLFGEIFLIIISIISMLISCYYKKVNFEDNNIYPLKKEEFKSKIKVLLYLAYFSILINSIYNKSFLTLAYLIFYQILLILISLKIVSFKFLKNTIIVYLFFYPVQLILINFLNIHSFQEQFLKVNIIMKDVNQIDKVYSILTMVGFNYSYYHNIIPFLYEWISYLSCILTIALFTEIQRLFVIMQESNKKSQRIDSNKDIEIEKEKDSACNKVKIALKNFFINIEFLWFIFRFLSLLWILKLNNFLALGIFIFIFFSFIVNNNKFIFNLIIFLLIPINLITIGCLHISNINGISENIPQSKKKFYNDFAYVKDDSNLYYILAGVYFIFIIIFLNLYNKKKLEIKIPKENIKIISEDIKNKVINDENEEPLIDDDADVDDKIIEENINNNNNIQKNEKDNKKKEVSKDLKLWDVFLKWCYINMDKITLVAMYFISMHTINIIHFFFIIIFLIQILKPNFTKKYSKLIVILIQILFLFEYIVAITSNYYEEFFLENYKLFEFLLSVSKNDESYEINIYIEIWCYIAIYVFYFLNKLLSSDKYNELKKDKNNTILNYIKLISGKHKTLQKIIFIIFSIIMELYIYGMFIAFFLACCNFEINLLISVKLGIFLVLVYKYFLNTQNSFRTKKISSTVDSVLIGYCCFSSLVVYAYQLLCLDFFGIYEDIKKSENIILKNLPAFGLINYEKKNLLYRLLPHFLSNFLSMLIYNVFKFLSERFEKPNIENDNNEEEEVKEEEKEEEENKEKDENIIINNDDKSNIIENKEIEDNKEKKDEVNLINTNQEEKKEEQENIENDKIEKPLISEEQKITDKENKKENDIMNEDDFNKFFDDIDEAKTTVIINKDKKEKKVSNYFENIEEEKEKYEIKIMDLKGRIYLLNLMNIIHLLIIFILRLFFPSLFLVFCYFFTMYKLSFSFMIYFLILGINIILMFSSILSNMKKFLRNTIILNENQNEKNIRRNLLNKYEFISYKFITYITLLFLFMSHLYSIIYGLKSKCKNGNEEKDCNYLEEINSGNLIQSIAYILGVYNYTDYSELFKSNYLYITTFFLIVASKYINLFISIIEKFNKKNRRKYKYLNEKIVYLMDIVFFAKYLESKKNQTNKNKILFERLIKDYDEYTKNKRGIIKYTQTFEENIYEILINPIKTKILSFLRIFNKIYQHFIIFSMICCVVFKINIWSFIYIILIILFLFKRKNINKFYYLFIFIIISTSIQSIIFISNINRNNLPEIDEKILDILNTTLSIPLYEKYLGEDYTKNGVLFGVGINRSELLLIWCEIIIIFLIYIYLYYFSIAIYHEKKTELMKIIKENKIEGRKSTLHDIIMELDEDNSSENESKKGNIIPKIKEDIKINSNAINLRISKTNMPENNELIIKEEKESDKLINLDLKVQAKSKSDGNKKKEKDESNIIYDLLNDTYLKYYLSTISKEDYEKVSKIMNKNFNVEIPSYDEMNYILNQYNEEMKKNMEKRKKSKFLENIKNQKFNINIFYYILFLFSHNLFLIIILSISMMIPGILSAIIIFFCLYFLYFCHLLSKGQTSYYPFIVQKVLRFIIIIDITFELIVQFVLIYNNDLTEDNTIFNYCIRILGFRKILNKEYEMTTNILYLLGKCFCYFLMTLQKIIYRSRSFKIFYLGYIIKIKMHSFKINSIINTYIFNNERINAMNCSIKIKQDIKKSMRKLKNIIKEWSKNLEKKSTLKKGLDNIEEENTFKIDNNNQKNDINIEKKEENKESSSEEGSESSENIDLIYKSKIADDNKIICEKMVKEIINEWILGQTFLIKIYSFLNKKANCLKISSYMKEGNKMIMKALAGINEYKPKIEKIINHKIDKLHLSSFKEEEIKNLKKFLKLIDKMDRNKIEKFLSILKEKKKDKKREKENEELIKLMSNDNYKQIINLKKSTLFNRYLSKCYLIKKIIEDSITLISNKFYWICYLFMIINHMVNASIISILYPLSIFCYALLENPRPSKRYWRTCYIYTFIIIVIKYLFQMEFLGNLMNYDSKEDDKPSSSYEDIKTFLDQIPIGIKIFDNNKDFFKNISIDFLVLIVLIINRNILWINGLWEHDEIYFEDIEKAMKRVSKHKNKSLKVENKMDLFRKITGSRPTGKAIISRKKLILKTSEKGYWDKLFPKLRNEKPGRDFYYLYALAMIILIFYVLIFYTTMVKDKTYGDVNISTNQFSGMSIILVLIHMIILIIDRVIYLGQNRYIVTYEYILCDKNETFYSKKASMEKIKEIIGNFKEEEDKQLLSNDHIKKITPNYNISIFQNETFNTPLLEKYILHIILTVLSHSFIFFFITMYGNYNIYNATYCIKDSYYDECNNFQDNVSIIFFYLIYLFYLTFSALQIKYGFYDLKRTSIFKNVKSFHGAIFEIYKLIPFYYQIKHIVDWTFTSTSFDIFIWFKFEYIYDEIFKTYRRKYGLNKTPVGQKIRFLIQILTGGFASILLIFIIILPLIIFSSLNPTSQINNVNSSDIKVYMSFIDKNEQERNILIFENDWAKGINIITDKDWDKYEYSKSYYTKTFPREQVQTISFYSEPENSLSNFKLNHLLSSLESLLNKTTSEQKLENERIIKCKLKIEINFMRNYPLEARTVKRQSDLLICDYNVDKNSEGCKGLGKLYDKFNGTNRTYDNTDINFIVSGFSYLVRLSASSEPKDIDFDKKSNLILQTKGNNTIEIYFEKVDEDNGIQYHVMNEKVSSGTFGYNVIGFYSAFILVIGTYVTSCFKYEPSSIIISEMPHPKKLLILCEGIKISRYLHDFINEEYYFNFLIEILRTPDLVKKLTTSTLEQFSKRQELPT